MKYFGIFLIVIVIVIAASVLITRKFSHNGVLKNSEQIEQIKQKLIAADKAFNKESLTKGTGRAFIDFAADSAIIMRQGQYTIIGQKALEQFYKNKDSIALPLKWSPEKAVVSPDGKMGYTFGTWKFVQTSDSNKIDTTKGNYAIVWQKQLDDSWKYTLYSRTTLPSKDTTGIKNRYEVNQAQLN